MIFSFSEVIFAGNFNYGNDVYEKWDDILIINSLGDNTSISTFGKLGANDYIPENSFKNLLAYEGYSVAYDYNPNYDGYYSDIYNQKLPDEKLTKITIAGLAGDPSATQDVYVLTSEYNRLSAQGQAESIDNLNYGLSSEVINRINGDKALYTKTQNLADYVDYISDLNYDEHLEINGKITNVENNLDTEASQRIANDTFIANSVIDEINNRVNADLHLQENINTIDTNSKTRDGILNDKISIETQNRIIGDNQLQNNINVETNNRVSADNQLNDKINNVDNRISRLEKTQYNLRTEIKFIKQKRLEVGIYGVYNTNRRVCSEVGINIVIPVGESYQDKENKKINQRLANIEKKLGNAVVMEKVVNEKGQVISINIGSFDVKNSF